MPWLSTPTSDFPANIHKKTPDKPAFLQSYAYMTAAHLGERIDLSAHIAFLRQIRLGTGIGGRHDLGDLLRLRVQCFLEHLHLRLLSTLCLIHIKRLAYRIANGCIHKGTPV